MTHGSGASAHATLDCLAVVRRLWDYLDGRLPAEEAAAIDAHLAGCAECPPHFVFERAFLAAVSAARLADPDVARLRARVLERLRAGGFGGP
jgi:anti-sigma factor (TIGR02949 family)